MPAYFGTKKLNMIKINDEQYLYPEDYARNKGVTVQTVYNWIKEDKLITRKLMNRVIVKL